MKRSISIILAAALAAPIAGHAATLYQPGNASCSGAYTVNLEGQVSLSCQGDLLLSGGQITSDTRLSIFSSGALRLEGIKLVGDTINLTGLELISADGGVIFDAHGGQQPLLTLSNGDGPFTPDLTQLASGALNSTIVFPAVEVAAVPEPATWALMLAGVAMLGAFRRR